MLRTVTVTRPLQMRIVSASTLVIILAWAAVNGDTGSFGVLAYPAIIALQTAREWVWRLEASKKGLVERPGIGPTREIPWSDVEAIVMPNAAWWRINPVLRVSNAPNVQLTAADHVDVIVELAVKRGIPVEGSADSIALIRSLAPWIVLLGLASLLLGSQLAGTATA